MSNSQTPEGEQVTGLEPEVVRAAFDTLFTALETAPHNIEDGIKLWNDGQPAREILTDDQIHQVTTTRLESLLTQDPNLTIILINTKRKAAGLENITEANQVLTEENIGLYAKERLQRQEEYLDSLPFRIPDDQLIALNQILYYMGVIPEGARIYDVNVLIKVSHRGIRSDNIRIFGYLIFDEEAYPTVTQHAASELVREFHCSIARDRGEYEGEPFDELDISSHTSFPEIILHNLHGEERQRLVTELLDIKQSIEACNASVATRCEQCCFVKTDLELLKFFETMIGQISAKRLC